MPTTSPPFDAELSAVLAVLAERLPSNLTPDMIEPMRPASITPPIEEILAARLGVTHRPRRAIPSVVSMGSGYTSGTHDSRNHPRFVNDLQRENPLFATVSGAAIHCRR